MENDHQRLENRIIYWTIIGPLSVFGVLIVSLFKGNVHQLYMPVIAAGGVFLCWKWRMKGLYGSVAALACLLLCQWFYASAIDRFWFLGISISYSLALVATVLAFQEVAELIGFQHVESNGRLDNLWRLDEKLKQAQEHWRTERQGLVQKIQEISAELAEKESLASTWEEAVKIVRHDLDASQLYQDRLLEELYEKRTEMAAMREKLQPQETAKQGDYVLLERQLRHAEGKYGQLRDQFEEKSRILDATRKELFHSQDRATELEKELAESRLTTLQEVEGVLQERLDRLEADEPIHLVSQFESVDAEELESLYQLVEHLLREKGLD